MEPKKLKIGDSVRIISRNNVYFNRHATIIRIDQDNLSYRSLPYLCEIKIDENNSLKFWCGKYDLELLKNPKNYFTISLKKHKRINLKFAL